MDDHYHIWWESIPGCDDSPILTVDGRDVERDLQTARAHVESRVAKFRAEPRWTRLGISQCDAEIMKGPDSKPGEEPSTIYFVKCPRASLARRGHLPDGVLVVASKGMEG